jgi:tetratricopeptide (TPR) repeat protein
VAAFHAALELRKALADPAPDDRLDRRSQMIDDNRIGDALASRNDFAGALSAYRDGLAIARALGGDAGSNPDRRLDLTISLNSVGWMQLRGGDPAAAARDFTGALAIVRDLASESSTNATYRYELWLVATNLGDADLRNDARTEALDAYLIGRDAATDLVRQDGTSEKFGNALKISVDKIGFAANAMLIAGEYTAALAALDKATPARADQNWLDLIRAGCLMLMDRPDEARPLYLKHRGELSFGGKPFEEVAKAGFAQMRSRGLGRPLMGEIEETFATPP